MWNIIQQTFAAWWREIIPLTMMNAVWLVLQLPLITAAPATAALYTVASNVAQGDPAAWNEFWAAFRRYFWKALRWGLLQVLFYLVAVVNFAYYAEAGGVLWGLIKIVWGGAVIVWTALQLLYWPLLLEAEDQGMFNTLRNALVMLWLNPLFVIGLALLTAVIVVASMLITFPVGLFMAALVSLLGTFAVRDRLRAARQVQRTARP